MSEASADTKWKKLLLYGGMAAGVAAALYYLLKEDSSESSASKETAAPLAQDSGFASGARDGNKANKDLNSYTVEEVREILNQIVSSQVKMKEHMKRLTKRLLTESLTFEQTYEHVGQVAPDDPLEKYGLTMNQFDNLLNMHQHDNQVRQGIARICGMPETSDQAGRDLTKKEIIEVHSYMLEELEKLEKDYNRQNLKACQDMKTVTIAAQAIVGSKVERKFDVSSEDIERNVIKLHTELATDKDFADVNMRIQATMAKLMGSTV